MREISTKCSGMASNLKRANSDPRFAEFSDTETTDEFVARDTEVELDLRNGDGKVSTQIAFGHGGMNLMITGLTLRAGLSSADRGLGGEGPTLNSLAFLL